MINKHEGLGLVSCSTTRESACSDSKGWDAGRAYLDMHRSHL